MTSPLAEDEPPLDPDAARMVARVKWLMIISGMTTMVAIAAVIGVIGYKVFRSADSGAASTDITALVPRGAKVTSTAVVEDRIVVTLDVGGTTEIRTFDLKSLRQTGRLRFAAEP